MTRTERGRQGQPRVGPRNGDGVRRALLQLPMLTVNQVAAYFRVSKQAVHGWLNSGRLRARRSWWRDGVRRVSHAELVRFARNRAKKGGGARDSG